MKNKYILIVIAALGVSVAQAEHAVKKVTTPDDHKKLHQMMKDHFVPAHTGCSGFSAVRVDAVHREVVDEKREAHFVHHSDSPKEVEGFLVLETTNRNGARFAGVSASDIGNAGNKKDRRSAMIKKAVDYAEKEGAHYLETALCTREPDFKEQKDLFESLGAKVTQSKKAPDIYLVTVDLEIIKKKKGSHE